MISSGINNKTKLKEMNIKRLKLAIEQAQKVCAEMNKCANKFILQDSINEMNQAINYTHSSTQLKDKNIPTFMFWMDCNSIRMVEHNRFIKENKIMSFQEVSQKYINEMINI
tara:strand:+ start:450 stop:785 length:336 start_codon:yes stop_codon:yes gene_type:complete